MTPGDHRKPGAYTPPIKSGDHLEPYHLNRIYERLDELDRNRPGFNATHDEPAYVVMTPEDGIPGRVGARLGKALCTLHRLVPVLATGDVDVSDTGIGIMVFNLSEGEVGGSIFGIPVVVSGVLVALWEDCPAFA